MVDAERDGGHAAAELKKYFITIKYKQMYNLFMVVYTAVLFYVLTPGILLTLPSRSSKMVVAATHAVVFALVYKFTHKAVWRLSLRLEGFQGNKSGGLLQKAVKAKKNTGPVPLPNGGSIHPMNMTKK